MRAFAGFLVVVLMGCGSSNPPCVGSLPSVDLGLFEVGVPYEGKISFSPACPGASEVSFVGATLVDDQNVDVAAEWVPVAPGDRSLTVTVKFTPTRPGPHHYTARFQPNIGLMQGDLFSLTTPAVPRTVLEELPLPAGTRCTRAELMPGHTVVCELVGGFALEVIQNGAVTKRIEGLQQPLQWVKGGAALWVLTNSKLTRWVIGEGSVVEGQTATLPTTRDSAARVAPPQDSATLTLATETTCDGAMNQSSQVSELRLRWKLEAGTLVREMKPWFDPIENITQLDGPGALTPDGAHFWVLASFSSKFCIVGVDDSTAKCFAAPSLGSDTRAESFGMWFGGTPAGRVDLMDADGGVSSTGMPPNYSRKTLPIVQSYSGRPEVLALTVQKADGLVFERLPGKYVSGWADGERLLLMADDRVTVLQR